MIAMSIRCVEFHEGTVKINSSTVEAWGGQQLPDVSLQAETEFISITMIRPLTETVVCASFFLFSKRVCGF